MMNKTANRLLSAPRRAGVTTALSSLFASVLLFLSAGVHAENKLIHQAQYDGEYKSIDIVMARKLWQVSPDQYVLETKAKNFLGSVIESEAFLWSPDKGIQPLQYHYEQKIFGVKKIRHIDFDWNKKQAVSQDKDKKVTLELAPGTLGPLSYQLQMQLDLIAKPKLDADQSLDYHFISRNKLKHYVFALDTDLLAEKPELAKQATILKRSNESAKKTTRLWLNPHDHFTLLKLEQIKGKNTHTLSFDKGRYYQPLDGTPYAPRTESVAD
ncbi:hypothetical protein TDB9533_03826 [Thalassocella blandensis]|nr:hypothetical protein TDB9533_03826 [Thalassocella blandensis]